MFLSTIPISGSLPVADIVKNDYRTADVFLKYDIEFCCGGKWPLEMVCASKNLDITLLIPELEKASRTVQVSNHLRFDEWNTGFLADYIVNVHHQYLKTALPVVVEYVKRFLDGHLKKFPELEQLQSLVNKLYDDFLTHLQQEEEIFFPYIKQITHAHLHHEPYGSLLVRTLRKPLQDIAHQEHELLYKILSEMREITQQYTVPTNACVTHRVTFSKLKELDNDLVQHMHLENDILFPKAIQIEKELLRMVH
jgi:regulator of cell morphogenesis and NO signaling